MIEVNQEPLLSSGLEHITVAICHIPHRCTMVHVGIKIIIHTFENIQVYLFLKSTQLFMSFLGLILIIKHNGRPLFIFITGLDYKILKHDP